MKKSAFLVMLAIITAALLCACGGDTETSAEPENQTDTTQQRLLSALVTEPQVVFEESTESLLANSGENIATDTAKETTNDGISFTADEGENPFLTFTKTQDGVPENRAIYIQFKPSAKDFGFMLFSESSMGLTIGEENEPIVFLLEGNYFQPVDTDLRIEPGNWYYVVFAVDTEGMMHGILCRDGYEENAAYFSLNAAELVQDDYAACTWQFSIGFLGEAQFVVKSYGIYTFDEFVADAS